MVDISSQNNKINITVSSSGNTANTNVTPDYAQYYSEKSKEWAISNRIVDNIDYSSKYYANESKKQADISTAKATEVVESGNTAVSNIENARDNAITNVNTAGATQVSSVNTAGITQVANVNSAGTTQINLAKEQVTLATNQANIATEQATIATNKTAEVVASGNEALNNIDTAKDNAITTITTQETTSKNNVIATGNAQVDRVVATGNNYDNLTHKNITNCLLEVPQRIKLELNDGTLTLKAGSVVIVPNGFEADGTTPKFDEMTTTRETRYSGDTSKTGQWFIGVRSGNGSIFLGKVATSLSGTTETATAVSFFYNTSTNIITRYNSSAVAEGLKSSFPIAIVTMSSTGCVSIDQVFNGMGYIGSTVWVDKGVEGLIPNGRNEDGSLKNIEFTINKFVSNTLTFGAQDYYLSLNEYGTPLFTAKSVTKYDSDKNVIIDTYANTDRLWCFAGECTADVNNKITSFSIKLPFRAVDYNDFGEQLSDKLDRSAVKAYITETYVNGASWYRIWSDGWIEQGGHFSRAFTHNTAFKISFLKAFSNANNYLVLQGGSSALAGVSLVGFELATRTKTSYTAKYNAQNGGTHTLEYDWYACGY